jgi:hypothetical protein
MSDLPARDSLRYVNYINEAYQINSGEALNEPCIDGWVTSDFKVAISKRNGPTMIFSAGQASLLSKVLMDLSRQAYTKCRDHAD